MPTLEALPANPSLDHLRQQARALQRAVRAGDSDAADRVLRQHPDGVPEDVTEFSLSTAQLVIAREYGFPSWPRLRQYVDLVADYGWNSSPPPGPGDEVADEFCRLACFTQSPDDPDRWAQARRLLAEHPELTRHHIWAAAATADHASVRRLLDEDPARARLRGGPHHCAPLFYLVYSRAVPTVSEEAALTTARMLLDAGGDPNEGYLWNGRPYAYTLLTGLFGEGDEEPGRLPAHPHALALARLLLDAGADPNDSQVLYNRQAWPDDDHLELLFEYGLGGGDGGPWRARMADSLSGVRIHAHDLPNTVVESPGALLRTQLRYAIQHDFRERVRVLVSKSVDFRSPYPDGYTAVELAYACTHTAIVDYLVSQGAPAPANDPVRDFAAAAVHADRAAVDRLVADHPTVVDGARRARPALIVRAAGQGADGVALLAELGFDVNARGHGAAPLEQPASETALHLAAIRGDVDLAEHLLRLGADPTITDARFNATPLEWARHGDQERMVELLGPLTEE